MTAEIEKIKRELAQDFEMKNLGSLCYFLGTEIARNKSGISVSQRKCILDLLKETGMVGSKPVDTPVDPNIKLKIGTEDKLVDKAMINT